MEYTVVYSQNSTFQGKRKRFERSTQQMDGVLRVCPPIPDSKSSDMVVTLLKDFPEESDKEDSLDQTDSSDEIPYTKKKSWNQQRKGAPQRFHKTKSNNLIYSGPITMLQCANPSTPAFEKPELSTVKAFHPDDILFLDRWEVQIVGLRQRITKEPDKCALHKHVQSAPLIGKIASEEVPRIRTIRRPLNVLVCRVPRLTSNHNAPIQSRSIASKGPSLCTANTNCKPAAASASLAATEGPSNSVLSHIPLPDSIRKMLKPHQVTGVNFLWQTLAVKRGCILGDEMGLGKTLMTIACITAIHRTHREKQYVVVCPSSLIVNWANEFDKWLGRASQPKRVVVREGGSEASQQIRSFVQRTNQQFKHLPGQVLIVSYDLFRRNSNLFSFSGGASVGLLVVDEGHRLKTANESLTFTALESLRTDGRLCITATPMQNNLSEFFNLAHFCCPGILGPDMAFFRKHYERPIVDGNQKDATKNQRDQGLLKSKELESISKSFMIRRLQKDVIKATLPPRTEVLLFCRPSKLQCDLYKSVGKQSLVGNMADSLINLTNLRKICAYPLLHEKKVPASPLPLTASAVSSSGKLFVLDKLLEQIRKDAPDDKVVIVSNFTSVLSIIESSVLETRSYSYLRLDGSTQNRQSLISTFNRTSAAHSFCLLLSAKAGGVGLNIVGANRLFLFDPDWNPATCQQAMGRIYRHGQLKPCTIYRLFTTGTVEEVIYQRQCQKSGLAHQTVDNSAIKGNSSWNRDKAIKFTKEELVDCFTLNENSACCTKEKFGVHWPDYNSLHLSEQGCEDAILSDVAPSVARVLSFVHVVPSSMNESEANLDEELDSEQLSEVTEGYQSDSDEHEFAM